MSIKDEIIEEFFERLRQRNDFPNIIIDNIEDIFDSGGTISKDKIKHIIEQGIENEYNNQGA